MMQTLIKKAFLFVSPKVSTSQFPPQIFVASLVSNHFSKLSVKYKMRWWVEHGWQHANDRSKVSVSRSTKKNQSDKIIEVWAPIILEQSWIKPVLAYWWTFCKTEKYDFIKPYTFYDLPGLNFWGITSHT